MGGVTIGESIELASDDDDSDEELVVDLPTGARSARAAAEERLRESASPTGRRRPVHGSARDEAVIDEVLDEVDADRPTLDPDEDQVAYDLAEWDDDRWRPWSRARRGRGSRSRGTRRRAVRLRRTTRTGSTTLIERSTHPDELPAEDDDDAEPDEVDATQLGDLFVAADRLQHDPEDHEQAARCCSPPSSSTRAAPPYGFDEQDWGHLVERVEALAAALDEDKVDEEAVVDSARDLRTSLRPVRLTCGYPQ